MGKTIKIAGKEYPMNFSVRAAKEVTEKFDGLENVATAITSGSTSDILGHVIWLLALLISQGVERENLLNGTNEKPVTAAELEVLMGVSELEGLQGHLMSAMSGDMAREVEVADDQIKNGGATQG